MLKKIVVDDTIETLFRDSHTKHFEWIESSLDIKSLKKFEQWPNFIELTERRNLFVHSDGIVCKSPKSRTENPSRVNTFATLTKRSSNGNVKRVLRSCNVGV